MLIQNGSIYAALLVALCFIFSCSSSDDSQSSNSGHDYNGGRKVSKVQLLYDYDYVGKIEQREREALLKYDNQGRLTTIAIQGIKDMGDRKVAIPYDEKAIDVTIDYDFCMIVATGEPSIMFKLNERGYISQLEDCKIEYDKEGYLISAERYNGIWKFAYQNDDLIKFLSTLSDKGSEIFFVDYDDETHKENVFLSANFKNYFLHPSAFDYYFTVFIAYQAGLFGKVTKHFLNTYNTPKATIEALNVNYGHTKRNLLYHFIFTYD